MTNAQPEKPKRKRKTTAEVLREQFKATAKAGEEQAAMDREIREAKGRPPVLLPLQDIDLREGVEATRELNAAHVEALADSIRANGLQASISVDARRRVVTGRHRIAAVRLLAERGELPDALMDRMLGPSIPAILLPFDAEKDPRRALAAEIDENRTRKGLTKDEANEADKRLAKAAKVAKRATELERQGYRRQRWKRARGDDTPGVIETLQAEFSLSRPTIHRLLALAEKPQRETKPTTPTTPTDDKRKADAALLRACHSWTDARGRHRDARAVAIRDAVAALVAELEDGAE